MSFLDEYASSLADLGIENPSSQEFVDHPEARTVVAFFLGWTFIACLRYLVLAFLRHPFTAYLLQVALRRPILVTLAERQRASDIEGCHVQNWLHNTLQTPPDSESDRPEGTRHLSVVLTTAFTLGVLMNFLSLLDFRSSSQDVFCVVVIAWAGISISCAKLAGLLRITYDLKRLGTGTVERVASWIVLLLAFGGTLAHVTISIGATRDVPQLPGLSVCYRRHFLLTSLVVSLLNITLELYFMGRIFFLLVPQFLQFHHKVEVMMDVRVARVASLLVLDLLTLLPSAMPINLAAEFIPFSLGTLLVLAAFNHRPPKPTDSHSFALSPSHRTSVVTFPRNDQCDPDKHSMISLDESQVTKPDKLVAPAPSTPSRKSSIALSETPRKRHTAHKSLSRVSHVSYDSEAEARSVRGAVVSFAFRGHEIEPMPAVPYGIYQPKLVGSPKIVSRASPQPSLNPASDMAPHGHSPLTHTKALPPPKPSLGSTQLSVTRDYLRPPNSPGGSSVVFGSDIIRRSTTNGLPPKPRLARRDTGSTMKSVSHTSRASMKSVLNITHSPGYTGPDLRHYSMSSHSATCEARDYLDVAPRATAPFRMSMFGSAASRSGSINRPGTGGSTPSGGSSSGMKSQGQT